MGLDMYLYKKTYVRQWSHNKPEDQFQVLVNRGGKIYDNIKPERVSYITEEVGYWRKFNALHNWFVTECADGVDECQEIWIYRDKLEQLQEILHKIQLNNDLADELLPTTDGFFFGGTEYDEYYFEQVSETLELVEQLLSEPTGDIYYRASW
jgi:hypothetical protein